MNLHAHRCPFSICFSRKIRLRNVLFPHNGIDLNPPPRNSQFRDLDTRLPWRKNVLKFSVRSLNSDSGKPLQPEKEDESGTSLSADDKLTKAAKQEKIIALFRRIMSSISKAEAKRAKLTNPESPTGSTKKIRQQSQEPVKVSATAKSRDEELPQKRGLPSKKMQEKTEPSAASFSITRPPSNFVKASPIPHPSIIRGKPIEDVNDLPLEQMKLAQLKELAKSRAIKGYSKMKKGQLLELLSS